MTEKDCPASFTADIDKIISEEISIPLPPGHNGDEYREMLFVAQLLAKTDYVEETKAARERIRSNIQNNGQLDDEDLDLVAGGANLNAVFDKITKEND